jgi:hypothetical protein
MQWLDLLQWPAMVVTLLASWMVASQSEPLRARGLSGFSAHQHPVGDLGMAKWLLGTCRASSRPGLDEHPRRPQERDVTRRSSGERCALANVQDESGRSVAKPGTGACVLARICGCMARIEPKVLA